MRQCYNCVNFIKRNTADGQMVRCSITNFDTDVSTWIGQPREFADILENILFALSAVDNCPYRVEKEPPGAGVGSMSDGYHTFDELYEHRIALFAALCRSLPRAWKARRHYDGTSYDGWFIAGANLYREGQISYHIPEHYWSDFPAIERETAPEWDGHSPDDVIRRIWGWAKNKDIATATTAAGADNQP